MQHINLLETSRVHILTLKHHHIKCLLYSGVKLQKYNNLEWILRWTYLNVFLDIWFIIGHNECIWQISAFNLHKAVRCVTDATWQQFALQHCVYYSTLAIWCPDITQPIMINVTMAAAAGPQTSRVTDACMCINTSWMLYTDHIVSMDQVFFGQGVVWNQTFYYSNTNPDPNLTLTLTFILILTLDLNILFQPCSWLLLLSMALTQHCQKKLHYQCTANTSTSTYTHAHINYTTALLLDCL